jgi:hypothetical protein
LGEPRLGRHGLHGVEFLAPHQVHAGEHALELLLEPCFDLVADAGQGAERAARDARQIFEKPVLGVHFILVNAAAARASPS